jgi:hypothetical protein
MFAGDDADHEALVLRVQFNLEGSQAFEGSLYIELLSNDEERTGSRLRDALAGDDGPLSTLRGHLKEDDQRPETFPPSQGHWLRDLAMWPWQHPGAPSRSPRQHDVAISFRSADIDIVQPLHSALEAAGLHAYYHLEDERLKLVQDGAGSRISDIYGYLDGARCLIMVCSKDYFELTHVEPRSGNVYCPVELAAAVVSVAQESNPRPVSRVLHFARAGEDFDWRQFDERVRKTLEEFKTKVTDPRDRASELDDYEDLQVGRANRNLQRFLDHSGSNAKQVVIWDEKAPDALASKIEEMVDRIKKALS